MTTSSVVTGWVWDLSCRRRSLCSTAAFLEHRFGTGFSSNDLSISWDQKHCRIPWIQEKEIGAAQCFHSVSLLWETSREVWIAIGRERLCYVSLWSHQPRIWWEGSHRGPRCGTPPSGGWQFFPQEGCCSNTSHILPGKAASWQQRSVWLAHLPFLHL